jgi:type II secretion system protein C
MATAGSSPSSRAAKVAMTFRVVIAPTNRTRWLAKAARQGPLCAFIVIGALVVTDIMRLGMSTYRLHGAVPSRIATPARGGSIHIDVARTIAGHLFGTANMPDVGVSRIMPDAGGAFLLSGVIATADPKVGSAIIGRTGQATRLFQAGGSLAGLGSGRLYAVYSDRVILDLNGHFQTLTLPRPAWGLGGPALLAAGGQTNDEQNQEDEPEVENSPMTPVSLAQSVFANLNPVMNSVGGHFSGVRLTPSADDKRKFGLRDGDVVVAVNGVRLKDMSSADSVLQDEDDEHSAVSLTVLRNGGPQIIQVTNSN